MKTKEELKEMYINNHTKNWDDETKSKWVDFDEMVLEAKSKA